MINSRVSDLSRTWVMVPDAGQSDTNAHTIFIVVIQYSCTSEETRGHSYVHNLVPSNDTVDIYSMV